ncbi:hypothetical protein ANO14919_044800 [Xylariales sp. No.14919]|nr:hypothetical protein ANO14919_044800 [Xylariales sp. No.14919]
MGLFDSIKQDARSGNVTIYGQGLGLLSGITLSIFYLWGFFGEISDDGLLTYAPRLDRLSTPMRVVVSSIRPIDTFILPLGPFFLEIPHLHMRFPWIVNFYYGWFTFVFAICFYSGTHMMNVELFILSIATGLSGIQSGIIAFTNSDSPQSWNNLMRAGFYFSFTIVNLTSFGFRLIDISLPPSQIGYAIALSCIPAIVSTSTAAAYCLAAFRQRGFVISRTLGGSGIEPVNFTISGLGPGLNSIDGEGSIRL